MSGQRLAAGLALLALGCAGSAPPPAEPALVALEILRGFGAPPARSAAPRVIALLDATRAMSRRDTSGVTYFDAARAGAGRWLRELPAESQVELLALGGARSSACATPARTLAGPGAASDPSLQRALAGVSPAGEGSLAEGLFELASELPGAGAGPLRVVAWSSLRDSCDGSLCAAAEALARRGVRLDLVVLGDARAPACLDDLDLPRSAFTPPASRDRVGLRVERLGPEPAVVGCSEAGGLPVAVPLGTTRIVVALDPPLILERSFPPDTRWILEILDFPTLGPEERQWRWRPFSAPGEDGGGP